ncbi:YihY/virulence factor BrkB family protein [Nocardioides sp. ChNu-153]|uniref:YihY/virulence factor BrkB family protein n=1 Tax=unclassified Nocardioides TaxID=2615069 RepID=UPI0024065A2E|nr:MULTISPECIES: YihY/virulence factor BrkB family protein [unclassified Nocardioides]MDF9716891.1 YihY/virulence factor BrkB family protein [Nocardioides sp. ChNu-99]MDN7123165.1 YihY/virulence factor BrkB family protein [Nocardioides sp. ChNu-153]
MTTARLVPVTTEMDGDELDAEDAFHLLRRVGVRRVLVDAFVRFRYGDGFSSSRALALQATLAVVPFLLALTGLAADLDAERPAKVIAATVDAVSPGTAGDDALVDALTQADDADGDEDAQEMAGEIALGGGLAFALFSMTVAMAQVERGTNRVYGIRRDRPAPAKYGRAALLAACLAGPVGIGFLLLVTGPTFVEAMATEYGWGETAQTAWSVGRWPVGILLLVVTIAVLLERAPRRRQPALSWVAFGSAVTVVLVLVASGGLAAYVGATGSFSTVYGPLTGVIALLLWALLSAGALFYGAAVCAQMEACRAGEPEPAYDDPGRPHGTVVGDAD